MFFIQHVSDSEHCHKQRPMAGNIPSVGHW
jgi:hypothetical protein